MKKTAVILSFLLLGLVSCSALAAPQQKSCTYKYLSCKDNCDYFQDEQQIHSCKATCNRKYSCRPRKVHQPKNHLEE